MRLLVLTLAFSFGCGRQPSEQLERFYRGCAELASELRTSTATYARFSSALEQYDHLTTDRQYRLDGLLPYGWSIYVRDPMSIQLLRRAFACSTSTSDFETRLYEDNLSRLDQTFRETADPSQAIAALTLTASLAEGMAEQIDH